MHAFYDIRIAILYAYRIRLRQGSMHVLVFAIEAEVLFAAFIEIEVSKF